MLSKNLSKSAGIQNDKKKWNINRIKYKNAQLLRLVLSIPFNKLPLEKWRSGRDQIIALNPQGLSNLSRLNCKRVLEGDRYYIERFIAEHGRINLDEKAINITVDCKSIRARNYFAEEADQESIDFPLAYCRSVYRVCIHIK